MSAVGTPTPPNMHTKSSARTTGVRKDTVMATLCPAVIGPILGATDLTSGRRGKRETVNVTACLVAVVLVVLGKSVMDIF
jgi:hypothetical protein